MVRLTHCKVENMYRDSAGVYHGCIKYVFMSLLLLHFFRLIEAKDDLNRSLRNTSSGKIIGDMETRELRRK